MLTWLKRNKYKTIPFLVVVILATSFVVYYLQNSSTPSVRSAAIENIPQESETNTNTRKRQVDLENEQGENPFSHRGTLSEDHVQNYIHWMSHQKVVAEDKWTHYLLTPERVEWLLAQVEASKYQHEDIYLDILKKWQNGNFSSSDTDHNRIWSLQGGTIGKATGVLTPEEEEDYLKKFRRKLK
ncbi:DUF6241 domain-containing protein [Sutcliffiella halmapala]|uniref:DUF6241 domain-containing protein n=1 Tax=Sutcliffiella halmapala TaxID=79882 RepID=UPI000994B314|nr:DUF6241 domain-containing protein [Sutcliffiella halmapala]